MRKRVLSYFAGPQDGVLVASLGTKGLYQLKLKIKQNNTKISFFFFHYNIKEKLIHFIWKKQC